MGVGSIAAPFVGCYDLHQLVGPDIAGDKEVIMRNDSIIHVRARYIVSALIVVGAILNGKGPSPAGSTGNICD
jgi:hypothetical protein